MPCTPKQRQFLHPSLPFFRSLFLNPSSWSLSLTVTVTVFFWAEESRQFYLFSDPEFDRLFSNPQPQTVPCYEKSQVSVIRQWNRVSRWGPDCKKTAMASQARRAGKSTMSQSLLLTPQSPLWSCLISIQPPLANKASLDLLLCSLSLTKKKLLRQGWRLSLVEDSIAKNPRRTL